MGALCLSTAVLRRAPPHVRAPAPRKKPLSAPRGSALRQKTRHCPKPLTFSEMDIIIIKHTKSACLAQPVEHAAVNRSVGGSSPSTGAIVAARRTSQHLAQQRGVFACMPAAPLRVAKMQDVRCAPRSCGTIAPLSHFCSAGRLRRGFFPFFNPLFSNPLTLFSPCTTPACRSVGENSLFRRALRSLRGSSPLAGAIVAARRTSQHLAQ